MQSGHVLKNMRRSRVLSIGVVLSLVLAPLTFAMPPRPVEKGQAQSSAAKAAGRKSFSTYIKKHPGLNNRAAGLTRLSRQFGAKAVAKLAAPRAITGSKRALVILVDFSDNTSGTPEIHYQEMLFSSGVYNGGSLRDYYAEVSYSQLDLTGDATGWHRLSQNYSYYTNNENGFGDYPRNAQKLVEDAVLQADQHVDFSRYDNDGDGYVDMVFVVHAGGGAEADGGNTGKIWSHMWAAKAPISVDGVKVYFYSMEPEDGTIGVFCHELGHVFGLPDLYDYGYDSRGVGEWSIMAAGSWLGPGHDGSKPAHFDAWSKTFLGWVKPDVKKANETAVAVPQVETNKSILKLWTKGEPAGEYFLVENRQKIGFDAYLPGSGLLIWHIDESRSNNDDQSHYKVAVEQADGAFQLENNVNSGDAGDPWPGANARREFTGNTDPDSRSYSAKVTSVAVTNISDSGSNMTASFSVGAAVDGHVIIEGYLKDDLSNGIAEVTVSAYAGGSTVPVNSYKTSNDGLYRLYLSSGVDHLVVPAKSGWSFVPSSKSYTPLASNQTNQDYTAAAAALYSVSGYVRSGAAGLAGIRVLLRYSGIEQSTATSGAGYYQFAGLKPGSYEVIPSSSYWAFTPQSSEFYLDQNSYYRDFSAVLSRGAVSGTVKDASGNPVSGTAVHAYGWSGLPNVTVYTGANGAYSFNNLSVGTYDLYVEPPPDLNLLRERAQAVQVSGGQTLALNFILHTGGRLTGTVKDPSGTGVQSVWVYASDWESGTYGSTQTDSGGNYSMPRLDTGNYYVGFQPSYNSTLARKYAETGVKRGETTTLNVTLETAGTISGRVLDPLGTPIQNANVYASDWVSGGWGYGATDAGGNFQARGLSAGQYILSIEPPSGSDYVRERKENISVASGETASVGDIVLVKGAKISGYVMDSAGDPVSGAWIYAYDWYTGSYGYFTTGSDGAYLIKGLNTGTVTLYAEPPASLNLVRKRLQDISVVEQQTLSLNITLETGGIMNGTVTDAAGRPISNLWVYASYYDAYGGGYGYGWGSTGSDGAYNIKGLATGSYYVSFNPSNDSDFSGKYLEDISIVAGSTVTLDVSLVIGGRIAGGVADGAGNPVSRAYVYTYASYSGGGEDGEVAEPAGPAANAVQGAAGAAMRQALALPRITSGLRASADQGQAGPAARLAETLAKTFDPKRNYWGSGMTDYAGNFIVRGLDSGEFTLAVQSPRNSDLAGKSVQGIAVTQGQTSLKNVVLEAAGKISGRVTDSAGNGIPATEVSTYSMDGWGYAATDSDGSYLIKNLPAGAYRVYARPRSGSDFCAQTAVNVPVRSGETALQNFTLVQGGKLSGRITDAKTGDGVSGIQVSADNYMEYSWGSGVTDSNGYFSISGLAQGKYTMHIYTYGTDYAREKVKSINIVSGSTTELNVSLYKGGKITGSLADEAGNLVLGGFVHAYSEYGYGGWGYAYSSTGTYTITGLPSGTYVVDAEPPYSSKLAGKHVSGIAVQVENTTVVDLKLPVAGALSGSVAMQGLPTDSGYWYGAIAFRSPKTFSAGTLYSDIMDAAYWGMVRSNGSYTIPRMAPDSYDVYAYLDYSGFSESGAAPAAAGAGMSGGQDLKKLLVRKLSAKPARQSGAQSSSGGYESWVTFLGGKEGVTVKSGQTEAVAAIAPGTGTGVLSGSISAADGSSLYNEEMWPLVALINSDGGLAAFGFVSSEEAGLTRVKYKIGNLEAGSYTAVAIAGGFAAQSAAVKIGAGAAARDFSLTKGSSVSGRVRNANGSPVNGASMRVTGANLDKSASSNSEGYYLIEGLSAGQVSLSASAQGYTTSSRDLTIEKSRAYSADFSLAPAGQVVGKVTVLGEPYQGAQAIAISKDYSAVHKTLTGADGTYRLEGLGFGEYYVAVAVEGYEIGKSTAVISASSTTATVDFDLGTRKVVFSFGIYQLSIPRGAVVTVKSDTALGSFAYKFHRENGSVVQEGMQSSSDNVYTLSLLSDTIPSEEALTLEVVGSLTEKTPAAKETFAFQLESVTGIDKEVDDLTGGKILMEDSGEQQRDRTSVEFGAGSLVKLSSGSQVHVSLVKSAPPADISGKSASSMYEIELKNADLAASGKIILSLGYDSGNVSDPEALSIFAYDPGTGSWVALEGASLDALNNTLTIKISGGELGTMSVNAAPAGAVRPRITLGAGGWSSRFVVMEAGANYTGEKVKVFNFPNPFDLRPKTVPLNSSHAGSVSNPLPTDGTVIKYQVPPSVSAGHASIRIYTLAGELVRVLAQGQITGGKYYYATWDGRNGNGRKVANGVYYGILELPGVKAKDATFKMVVIK